MTFYRGFVARQAADTRRPRTDGRRPEGASRCERGNREPANRERRRIVLVRISLAAVVTGATVLVLTTALAGNDPAEAGGSVLVGDANCDGIVNPVDSTFILQLSAGLLGALPCPQNGDASGDGVTNPLDSALILQFSAGLIDSLASPPTSTNTPQNPVTPPPSATSAIPTPLATPSGLPIQFCWLAIVSYHIASPNELPASPSCNVPGTGASFSCSYLIVSMSCDTFRINFPDYDCDFTGLTANCKVRLNNDQSYTCTGVESNVSCTTSVSNLPDYTCVVSGSSVECTTANSNYTNFDCSFDGLKFSCA